MPGRCEEERDSQWVAAAAAPRGGNVGGPGPHPARENAGAGKGHGRGIETGEGAAPDPRTEGAPDLQDAIDPPLLPPLGSKKEEMRKRRKQKKQRARNVRSLRRTWKAKQRKK